MLLSGVCLLSINPLDCAIFQKMKLKETGLLILFIVSIALALWHFLSNSQIPTFEQTIIIFTLALLLGIWIQVKKIKTNLKSIGGRFNRLEKSFTILGKDFKEHIKHKK